MSFDLDKIQHFYGQLASSIEKARQNKGAPLTLTEKILFSHLITKEGEGVPLADVDVDLSVDRVAMRDDNAQLPLLQFVATGRSGVAVPTTVHCDHLIVAEFGAKEDLLRANGEQKEIFDFLQSVCGKYGLGFWKPGSGIVNQVVLENYAFPGGLMIATDPYISNVGGLGMLGLSAGGSDAVGVMAGMSFEMPWPKVIAIVLKGQLSGWAAPKDVALKVWELLSIKGAAGAILEYIGEGAATLSCSGKATICNMGSETGAVASVFPYDGSMSDYLIAMGRKDVAELADGVRENLVADKAVLDSPQDYYSQVIEIDLSELEPRISGPQGIEKSWTLAEFAHLIRQNGYPEELSVALIGSCVNSSYEDVGRAVSVARQALKHGFTAKSALMYSPGSENVRLTLEREGSLKVLEEIGSTVFAAACGPCAGLWKRHDVTFGEKNSILTSFNRSFSGRHDGNPGTHAFVASPEIVMALALAGRLTFNPMTDALMTSDGLPLRFTPPVAEALPKGGFEGRGLEFFSPAPEGLDVSVAIDPDSKRLQLLKPFKSWNEREFIDMRMLIKAAGRLTAEQLSSMARCLKFRGHLDGISDHMGSSVANALRSEVGKGKNLLTGEIESYAKIAKDYKKEGIGWVIVGEENYGEGASCELVAMVPRYLGCKLVIAKSFAKACEMNLKRQGVLALSFAHWEDYGRIREDDFLDLLDIKDFAPGKSFELLLKHADGTSERVALLHSYTPAQVQWFKAGSALNACRYSQLGALVEAFSEG